MKYPIPKECPYCGAPVIKTTNDKIYGVIFGNGQVYMCTNDECDAYVGCHNHGEPLGRLANKELRELKLKAHNLFDPVWKTGKATRGAAYGYLAKALGISKGECHFGWFDKDMLLKAIAIMERWKFK